MNAPSPVRSLEEQLAEFRRGRFLAMPLAGLIAWTVVGIGGLTLKTWPASMLLFVATGSIAYLGMFLSKFTGEDFLDKSKPKNTFDALFFYTMGQSLLVFAIAIPFFMIERTSLPMSVGILSGLMWVPMTWLLGHWIGVAHGVARTVLILVAWYALPEHRFVAVPAVIVVLYVIAIAVLEHRWRKLEDRPRQ